MKAPSRNIDLNFTQIHMPLFFRYQTWYLFLPPFLFLSTRIPFLRLVYIQVEANIQKEFSAKNLLTFFSAASRFFTDWNNKTKDDVEFFCCCSKGKHFVECLFLGVKIFYNLSFLGVFQFYQHHKKKKANLLRFLI